MASLSGSVLWTENQWQQAANTGQKNTVGQKMSLGIMWLETHD